MILDIFISYTYIYIYISRCREREGGGKKKRQAKHCNKLGGHIRRTIWINLNSSPFLFVSTTELQLAALAHVRTSNDPSRLGLKFHTQRAQGHRQVDCSLNHKIHRVNLTFRKSRHLIGQLAKGPYGKILQTVLLIRVCSKCTFWNCTVSALKG